MQTLNPIAKAVIDKNKQTIGAIISFYGEMDLPAFIKIETGTTDRLVISPVWAINLWLEEKENTKLLGNSREEFFKLFLNPYTLCSQMPDEQSEYFELLKSLSPFSGVVAIDYEAEDVREFFEPVLITVE